MFYYLNGDIAMISPNTAAIDCSGVAYKLNISYLTYEFLAKIGVGKKAKLYTYLAVREDAMELYGFMNEKELDTFTLLISVSGVGPKAAVAILSQLTPDIFAKAVAQGDAKLISKANGVGAKTAQRIILELHDKLAKQLEIGQFTENTNVIAVASETMTEAVNALCVLGFTRVEASKAVSKAAKPDMSLEDIINSSLKLLVK